MFYHPLLDIAIKGIVIGILVSAPMGPTGVLCIRRTLRHGWKSGLYTGLGAALSDIIYASIAYLGIGVIIDFLEKNQLLLQLLGSLLVLFFGLFLYLHPPKDKSKDDQKGAAELKPAKMISSSFLLTFGNPLIVFFFLALYSRFNVQTEWISFRISLTLNLLFIAIGAFLWWFFVTHLIGRLRTRANIASLNSFNRIVAILFMIVAAIGLISGGIEFLFPFFASH